MCQITSKFNVLKLVYILCCIALIFLEVSSTSKRTHSSQPRKPNERDFNEDEEKVLWFIANGVDDVSCLEHILEHNLLL